MSAPLAIINLKATSAPEATIAYFANPKKVVAVYDGLGTGVAVGSPKELADLLLVHHHNRRAKRVCRTAVLSVQTPVHATKEQLEDIDRRLLQAAADLQKILKVASMLGWIHGNTATRHLHLLFPNSNGRRTLDLRPKFLRQLQGFMWTMELLSGRGKGRRRALSVYPKARSLSARDLAGVLVDSQGNIRPDRWRQLVAQGQITNFRRRNDGSIVSFEWGGNHRRMRVATLQGFAIECQNTQPATDEPYESSPQYIEPGRSTELLPGPGPQPPTGSLPPAVASAAGRGQLDALSVALPTKPTISRAVGLVGSALEAALPGQLALEAVAPSGSPEPGATGADSLPVGGLAEPGQRRFRRRAGQQPAAPEVAATTTPAPKFKRLSRPGIGL